MTPDRAFQARPDVRLGRLAVVDVPLALNGDLHQIEA
jgi:hypothetical protein